MKRLKEILRDQRGEGYVDVVVILLVALLVIALGMKVFPVFVAKNELNTFANELARVAEIEGRIGSATNIKENELEALMGFSPDVSWSTSGRVQLNDEFTVTVTQVVDIGFFEFGSFPITLTAKASGRSEVYWK
jgi:Flp pilus assembly protein TadG